MSFFSVKPVPQHYFIWAIGVSFVLLQFFLQLSSGLIIGSIMHDSALSAFEGGVISSAFYYVYTCLQIPVGMLFDRYSPKYLLSVNALLCGLGCLLFSHSDHVFFLILSRMLMGMGSAFAFVGLSHLLRQFFSLRRFALMIGLSETLGFLTTVFGVLGLSSLITYWGWRKILMLIGYMGFLIAYLCWQYIPLRYPKKPSASSQQLSHLITNRKLWINGIFVGLSFSVITVFGAMWAVPFIQIKAACSLTMASRIDAMIFLGAALSCPLFGYLASYFSRRKPLMLISCLLTAGLIVIFLYFPIHNYVIFGVLMFFIGLCCGSYMLAFSIANELAPTELLSTCAGFTNTLAMLTAPLLQPALGFLFDQLQTTHYQTTLENYQLMLSVIPLSLLMAGGLVCLLPEKET